MVNWENRTPVKTLTRYDAKIKNLAGLVDTFLQGLGVTYETYQKVRYWGMITLLIDYTHEERIAILGEVQRISDELGGKWEKARVR